MAGPIANLACEKHTTGHHVSDSNCTDSHSTRIESRNSIRDSVEEGGCRAFEPFKSRQKSKAKKIIGTTIIAIGAPNRATHFNEFERPDWSASVSPALRKFSAFTSLPKTPLGIHNVTFWSNIVNNLPNIFFR